MARHWAAIFHSLHYTAGLSQAMTSTNSAPDAPSQKNNIPTANLHIESYLEVDFQRLFALLLGQGDFRRIALMIPSSGKLLGVPGDIT